MMKYRIDRKTPDYITLNMNDFLHSFSIDTLLEEGLEEETFKMANDIREFECQIKQCVYEFKIRKDSVLGRYLVENDGKNGIADYTDYISYHSVCEAYLISSFQNDAKMTNKLLTLLQQQCSGFKEELLKDFPRYEEALDFILENNDFEKYRIQVNHQEGKNSEEPFVAFEDGEWTIKTFGEEQKRILKNKEVPYEED